MEVRKRFENDKLKKERIKKLNKKLKNVNYLLDFSDEEDSYEIITDPDDFSAVRDALEKEGIPMAEAEVTMVPQTWATLTNEDDIKKMNRILDLLDEDDDVQNVYHNWDE